MRSLCARSGSWIMSFIIKYAYTYISCSIILTFQFKTYWRLIIVALLEKDTSAQLFKRIKKKFFPLFLLGNCQMKIDFPPLHIQVVVAKCYENGPYLYM